MTILKKMSIIFGFSLMVAILFIFIDTENKNIELNEVHAAATTYLVISDAKIRSGPFFFNKIVTEAEKGKQVGFVSETKNGWMKVSLDGKFGYINTNYLKTADYLQPPLTDVKAQDKEKPAISATPNIIYLAIDDLNIRTNPSTSSDALANVKNGSKLNVIENELNGWYKLMVDGKTGYANSQYVKAINIPIVKDPESIAVLINKKNMLPTNYTPNDLVYTSIPFITDEMSEKRKMRSEASVAISQLFDGAKKDNINLRGVSAYRSNARQTDLFISYTEKDGYDKALTYSALPGTSEHETGLTIDVTGADGTCAAQDCFGGTKEAKWLQNNAHTYGFIVRYPKRKEAITGYKYEPWHLRYVGVSLAQEITSKGITLEEYYLNK